jgi:hypothetical protein
MEACETARAEAKSQRPRAGDRMEVATLTLARGGVLLEHQKVIL